MSASDWLKGLPRGGRPGEAVERELARGIREVKNARVFRELTGGGEPPVDPSLQAVLKPILENIGQNLAQQVKATGAPPAQEDIDRELDKAVARLSKLGVVRELRRMDADEDKTPQPQSVGETVQISQAAVSSARDLVEMHQTTAELERERRIEAEQDMGGAIAHAKAEVEDRYTFILDLFKETKNGELERERMMSDLRADLLKAQHEGQLADINKQIQGVIAKYEGDLERQRLEHAREMARLAADHDTRLQILDKDHEIEKLKTQRPAGETPQDIVNAAWAKAQAADLEDEQYYKTQARQEDLAQKKAQRDMTEQLAAQAPEVLKNLSSGLGGLLAARSPQPRNGIPGVPPPAPNGVIPDGPAHV